MIIQHNLLAMNNSRLLGINTNRKTKSIEKLSSGYQINRAADDAAGLSISEKMRSQIRGLSQASTNAQDAISLIQTADGALNEVHSILHRMRELSVSAGNDTNVASDREAIQKELDELINEINRIGNDTEFNTKKLLNGSCSSSGLSQSEKAKFISWLNGTWLNDAANAVEKATGWDLDPGTNLTVTFTKSSSSYIASMSGWYLGDNYTLDINTKYLTDGITYNGTDGPTIGGIAADRVIAHEIVHQYMFDNVSATAAPDNWFIEGLAEAVNGGSDTRYSLYEIYKSNDFSSINEGIQNFDFMGNQSGYPTYTVGYLATSYLSTMANNIAPDSFKTMLAEMDQTDESFRDLVAKYTNSPTITSYQDFIDSFKEKAQTAYDSGTFYDFLLNECGIDILDGLADPIGAPDATASDVIPNSGGPVAPSGKTSTLIIGSDDGTGTTINITWDAEEGGGGITLQIGANSNQSMTISIDKISASALNIDGLNVSNNANAQAAIKSCDDAIALVSSIRSNLGASQNRLEHVIANLDNIAENTQYAESRIRDVDMAKEMVQFSKWSILEQAGQAMLVQANQSSQGIVSLLQQ